MTALTTAPASQRARLGISPVVSQLAPAEARRLVRHPAVLAGLALSLLGGVAAALTPHQQAGELGFMILSGAGTWPLAVGAFLAANSAASRTHRHGTDELEDSTVTDGAKRTRGLVAAMAALVIVAILLMMTDAVLLRVWDGIPVRLKEGFVRRPMHVTELAQGPAVVGVMAVLGLAFGRWVPSRLLGPLMLVPAVVGFFQVTWRFDGMVWRFAPVMVHEHRVGWVQVTPSSGYSILDAFAVGDLAWHLLYLVGLAVLLAAVAVARFDRRNRTRLTGLVGVALAAIGGILQLP